MKITAAANDLHPTKTARRLLVSIMLAISSVAVTVLLKDIVEPFIGWHSPFLLFTIPIAATAWYGGLWPGLLASVLAALSIDYFFLPHGLRLSTYYPIDYVRMLLFVLEGAIICGLTEGLHVTRRRLQATAAENARLYEEAQQANKAKDEFLALVSHELRNPMSSIFGWVRVLRAGTLDHQKTARAFNIIEDSVHTQLRLVNDLLDASRIITHKFNLVPRAMDLRDVVQGAVDTLSPIAEARSVNLTVDFAPGDYHMPGDPDRLQQVVWNLVSNALKFTLGGGTVHVRGQRKRAEFEIEVKDTGCGITAEFLPHVFERFRQEDGTTNCRKGLGLGLTISRHILKLHGGAIRAESPGKGLGSTFTITLPENFVTVPEERY